MSKLYNGSHDHRTITLISLRYCRVGIKSKVKNKKWISWVSALVRKTSASKVKHPISEVFYSFHSDSFYSAVLINHHHHLGVIIFFGFFFFFSINIQRDLASLTSIVYNIFPRQARPREMRHGARTRKKSYKSRAVWSALLVSLKHHQGKVHLLVID